MEYMKEKRTRKRTKTNARKKKKKLGLREGVRGRERTKDQE